MTNLNISETDFDTIKTQLKTFLKAQTKFQDYDFDGSNMAVLLDVLAYNAAMTNFYSSLMFSEMFIDSAKLQESVRSHAKHLNYLPRSRKSAQSSLTITFSANDNPSFITIPRFQKFTGTTSNNQTFEFSTNQAYVVRANNGIYSTNITIHEGRLLTEKFLVSGNNQQKFILSNKNIDTDSIEVVVFENSDSQANNESYSYRSNIFGVANTDAVFYLQPAETDKYQVYFGQDVFGKSPSVDQIVRVKYRISSANVANGVDSFSVSSIDGYSSVLSGISVSTGGSESESIEDIKFFAPKSLQVQERAVTENDYAILLQQRFSEISDVSVYGGEKAVPPKFGKVVVVVKNNNQTDLTEDQKTRYENFLKDKTPITITPEIKPAEHMYLQIFVTTAYNANKTDKSSDQIKQIVLSGLEQYSSENLERFDRLVKQSRISSNLDSLDSSIISNQVDIYPILEFVPTLNVDTTVSLDFGNALKTPHPIFTNENLASRKAGIKSSEFTIDNQSCFIIDNGLGVLQIYSKLNDGTFARVSSNIGTVNYQTGVVDISELNISSYEGSALQIFADTVDEVITSPLRKIIQIRTADCSIKTRQLIE